MAAPNLAIELVCAVIVALYAVARRDALPTLALLAVAGFIGEDSVIRAYGFYHYSPRWHLFLDRVPLMIVVIWPIVIHSAFTLARRLAPARSKLAPLLGAAIVLADASLIEPIAVHAGLWTWTAPGLFAVPPIGIIGWAYFAGAAMACLDGERPIAAIVVAPLATHVLLVASWWTAFKWLSRPLSSWPFVVAAWLVLGTVALAARRVPGRRDAEFRKDVLLRGPGAAFFFVLLVLYARDLPSLVVYALAFVPPYFALLLG
jgi:hypothetical protein